MDFFTCRDPFRTPKQCKYNIIESSFDSYEWSIDLIKLNHQKQTHNRTVVVISNIYSTDNIDAIANDTSLCDAPLTLLIA